MFLLLFTLQEHWHIRIILAHHSSAYCPGNVLGIWFSHGFEAQKVQSYCTMHFNSLYI